MQKGWNHLLLSGLVYKGGSPYVLITKERIISVCSSQDQSRDPRELETLESSLNTVTNETTPFSLQMIWINKFPRVRGGYFLL